MAFYSLRLGAGDRILTTTAEYASNYIPMRQVADRTGAAVVVVPDDEHGQVDVDRARRDARRAREARLARARADARAASSSPPPRSAPPAAPPACRCCSTPASRSARCRSTSREIGCDMLSATGRKFLRGPRGTGFLYVRRGLIEELEPPLLDLHAAEWQPDGSYRIRPDARRFENWETQRRHEDRARRRRRLRARRRARGDPRRACARSPTSCARGSSATPGVTVHDLGEERSRDRHVRRRRPPDRGGRRRAARATASTPRSPPPPTPGSTSARRGLDDVVRASPHYYNDIDELDRLVDAVEAL